MAEQAIVFPLVTNLLKTLGSVAVQEMGLIYGLHEELEKLQGTFRTIQAVLLDAEKKSNHSNGVKVWLEELKDVTYDIDDILDSFSYESMRRKVMTEGKKAKKVRIFFSKHNQIAFRREMAHEIKNLRKRLDNIADERNKYKLEKTADNESENGGIETHSFVLENNVIGRAEEKEEIVKHLLEINEEQNVSVNAIVGMGGMGKTTLAKSVFGDKGVKDAFDLRLWVCISQMFDMKAVMEKIIESATKQRPSLQELDSLQKLLRTQIYGKKYLLVIDDLWNDDGEKWDDLKGLLMGGARGSKILITTRSQLVAEVSQATSSYILNGLSESNSWLLFKKMAFKAGEEPKSPTMIQIGKEIAKECVGVPLVIRTIGRLLYSKTSEAEWLSFKNNDLATITLQENRITEVLKLSYNHLPSHLKPCFAYCSLFPEDHWFEKDKLVKLWVAEGFVQSQDENKCLEDVGDKYFMELTWRSIFQDITRLESGKVVQCKMHDLMHDLARLVARTECFTPNSDIENVNGRTRRIFQNRSREKWSVLSTPQLKPYKLRTLFLSNSSSWQLQESEIEAHISSLKSLRVLNLNSLNIEEVPFSIGMLKHLRYLDLSRNGRIKSLPSSVTKLHNLETLNISCLSLNELPEDIESLTNLRHLDVSDNSGIERLPNSITKLKFLQTLILSYTCLNELPENIGDMLGLKFLYLDGNSSINLLPNSIVKLKNLQVLNLHLCFSLRELPSDVSNLINLMHLKLESCTGLRGMPRGLNKLTALQTLNLFVVGESVSSEDSGLWQLNTLINISGSLFIRGLHHLRKDASQANTVNLKDIHGVRYFVLEWKEVGYNPIGMDPDFEVLEKLHPNKNVETLRIYGYGGVKLSSWVSSLSNLTIILLDNCERLQYIPRLDRLPNLRKLELGNMSLIEYIDNNEIVDEFGSSVFFPSLESLSLKMMDKLKGWWNPKELSQKDSGRRVSLPSFHCLAKLLIQGCPQLISIPSPNSSLETMGFIDSNVELFRGEPVVNASPQDDMQQREVLDGRDDLLSDGLQHLTSLQSLSIIGCTDLTVLLGWIGSRTSLQKLYIGNCPNLTSLSDWIGNLSSLEVLNIRKCPKLTLLPDGIVSHSSLKKLEISDCQKLDWIGNLTSLHKLEVRYCKDLASLPDEIDNLTSLQELEIISCDNLTALPGRMGNLASLQKLVIENCSEITSLGDVIVKLTSLQKLKIQGCPKLARLPENEPQVSSIRRLIRSDCDRRQEGRWTQQIGENWLEIAPGQFIRINQ